MGDAGLCPAGAASAGVASFCFFGALGICGAGGGEDDFNFCSQVFCPACTYADGESLFGVGDAGTLGRLCPAADICSLAMLECLSEQGPKLLSPSCAGVFTSLFEKYVQQLSDAGGSADACNPKYAGQEGSGVTFCAAIRSADASGAPPTAKKRSARPVAL